MNIKQCKVSQGYPMTSFAEIKFKMSDWEPFLFFSHYLENLT